MFPLSEGALDNIMNGQKVENPILQVLGYKKLPSTSTKPPNDRYRLLVSDGKRMNSFTMLTTSLNNYITENILTEYSICEVTKYVLSTVTNNGKEKRVLLIMDLKMVTSGSEVGEKIGNPTTMESKSESENKDQLPAPASHTKETATKNSNHQADIATTPIAALSPYQNRWVIRARVTNKSQIRTWSNSRGEGKLFSMDLIDDSGEIRCTAFREQCEKFYDMIQPGKVYFFSHCTVKIKNKLFNMLRNDYEIIMTGDTEIVPCHDNNDDIPTLQYNFVPISHVEKKEKNDVIDVLGVVATFGDVQHIVQQTTGRELVKRDVNIVDDSGTMVCVTLWGKQAEDFDGSNNAILAIKGARVGEFNGGKNLSLLVSSVLEKDPDLPEAHRLRGWYTAVGHSENAKSLSRSGGAGGDINAPLYTFQEVSEARLGEKLNVADTYAVVATINMIRVENSTIYRACPVDSCKKKLIDQSNGIFRCEKCQKEYLNYKYRLLLNMNIADATGSRWITAFKDLETLLGMGIQELGELKEKDQYAYMQKIGEARFKRFAFTVRAKADVYQDEMRVRHTCFSVAPVNYKTHLAHLLDRVSKLVHIEKVES